jgi:hypothetical protein
MSSYRWLLMVCLFCGFAHGAKGAEKETAVAQTNGTVRPSETFAVTGTVKRVSLEGGFWGVVGDDGRKYQPSRLPQEFQQDGLHVTARLRLKRGAASFRMWGRTVEIVEIARQVDDRREK